MPFPKVVAYFSKFVAEGKNTLLFDSFPYEQEHFEQLIKAIGEPTFIISLIVDKANLTARFKTKNEM